MFSRKVVSRITLLAVLLAVGCNEQRPEFQAPTAEAWSSMTSEERAAFLEERLDEAEAQLRTATTNEAWAVANEDMVRSLSLLRGELWATERTRYVEREAELEALAEQTRP